MPENNEFVKSVTQITDEKEYHSQRLSIATQAINGLLAAQDEKGWNLAYLAIVGLRAADALLEAASKPLPLPTTAPKNEEVQSVELEIVSEEGQPAAV
jgi:hypothetical protein